MNTKKVREDREWNHLLVGEDHGGVGQVDAIILNQETEREFAVSFRQTFRRSKDEQNGDDLPHHRRRYWKRLSKWGEDTKAESKAYRTGVCPLIWLHRRASRGCDVVSPGGFR